MKRDFSFHSLQRIKYKKEFQYLFQKSFRIYGSFFIYRIVFSELSYTKLGIITSKKFGNAVYRNHIKRIVREEFRHHEFPYSISLLVSQSKLISCDDSARNELKKVFTLLADKFFLYQCSVENTALKTAQYSSPLSFTTKISFYVVLAYKKYFSSSLKQACRFTPSCSVYALEALRVYGFLKGWFLIIKRLLSCRPSGRKGYNPVPFKNKNKTQ